MGIFIRYISNKLIINLFPVIIINFAFLLIWIFHKNIGLISSSFQIYIAIQVYVTLFQMIYNVIINPIYLIIINIVHSIKNKNKKFMINIALMMLSCIIGIFMHYFAWGITTGGLLNPDWGTILLFFLMLSCVPIIFIIGIIIQVIIYGFNKKKNKDDNYYEKQIIA